MKYDMTTEIGAGELVIKVLDTSGKLVKNIKIDVQFNNLDLGQIALEKITKKFPEYQNFQNSELALLIGFSSFEETESGRTLTLQEIVRRKQDEFSNSYNDSWLYMIGGEGKIKVF